MGKQSRPRVHWQGGSPVNWAGAAEAFDQSLTAYEERDIEKTIGLLRKAIGLEPHLIPAHINLGRVLSTEQRYEEALEVYQVLLRYHQDYPPAYNNMGLCYAQLGELEKALDSYSTAARLEPTRELYQTNVAQTLRDLKRYDEALALYRQALTLNPSFELALRGVAYTFMFQEEYVPAIAIWEKLLSEHPDFGSGWYNIGFALQKMGQMEEALSALDHCLQLGQFEVEALCLKGEILLMRLQRYEEALSVYQAALDLDPLNSNANAGMGMTLVRLGRDQEGIEYGNMAVRLMGI